MKVQSAEEILDGHLPLSLSPSDDGVMKIKNALLAIKYAQRQAIIHTLQQAEKELPIHLSGNILSLKDQILNDLKLKEV